jgi:hypothetical protein
VAVSASAALGRGSSCHRAGAIVDVGEEMAFDA